MIRIVFSLALCSLLMPQVCSGAEFRNLGFDEADTTGVGNPLAERRSGTGNPDAVLPGWNLYLGGERHGVIYVNEFFFPRTDNAQLGDRQKFGSITEGKFALRLERSDRLAPVWTLEQTGTMPASAKFLTYRCVEFGMQVEIDDEIIPPLDWQLPGPPGMTNLVYDISKLAGQEVKLAFVGPFGPYAWPERRADSYIDSITFLAEVPKLTAVVQPTPGAKTNEVTLRFTPIAGRTMIVEFQDDLSRDGIWQALPSSPATPGTITDKSPALHRFYRLRVSVPE